MDSGAKQYRIFLNGNDNGLAEIIRMYNVGLTLYLNSFVSNLSVADELSEDTFVKLGVKRPHFSGKSSFKTWLYAIGRNIAIDYLRKNAHQLQEVSVEGSSISEDQRVEEAYLKQEEKIELHRAIQKLKMEYRQVLWLVYFEELNLKETAAVMKKTVHSTENLVSRARKALKEELMREK